MGDTHLVAASIGYHHRNLAAGDAECIAKVVGIRCTVTAYVANGEKGYDIPVADCAARNGDQLCYARKYNEWCQGDVERWGGRRRRWWRWRWRWRRELLLTDVSDVANIFANVADAAGARLYALLFQRAEELAA